MCSYSEEVTVRVMECTDSNDSVDSHTVSNTSNDNIENSNTMPNENEKYKGHEFSDNVGSTATRANGASIQCPSGPNDPVQSLFKKHTTILNSSRHICLPFKKPRYVTDQKPAFTTYHTEQTSVHDGFMGQELIQSLLFEEGKILSRFKPDVFIRRRL